MRAAWSRARRPRAARWSASVPARPRLLSSAAPWSAHPPFPAGVPPSAFTAASASAAPSRPRPSPPRPSLPRPSSAAALSASPSPPPLAFYLCLRGLRGRLFQVHAAVRAEPGVAAVQLAAAGAGAAHARLADHGLAAGDAKRGLDPARARSRARRAAPPCPRPASRRPAHAGGPRRPGRRGRAARARAPGAGTARGAAAGCGGRSRRGARDPRARCPRAGAARPRSWRELRGRIRGPGPEWSPPSGSPRRRPGV